MLFYLIKDGEDQAEELPIDPSPKIYNTPRTVTKKNANAVENEDFVILPDDHIEDSALQFDHGCKCRRLLYTHHEERKRYG